jgi:hypothetical protein
MYSTKLGRRMRAKTKETNQSFPERGFENMNMKMWQKMKNYIVK